MADGVEKKYIFLTFPIYIMGGGQNYVRSKLKYLINDGWKVYIFFRENHLYTECLFEELKDYVKGGIEYWHAVPDKIYGTIGYYTILFKMLKHIGYQKDTQCQYFIESNDETFTVWGEILAQIVSGKHIYFTLSENFGLMGAEYYGKYIDYFKYKLERHELAGIAESSVHRMFEGYIDVPASKEYMLTAASEDNIRDINSPLVEQLPYQDWNIAYFGRGDKRYLPYILYEIRLFCRKYSTRKIHFIIISVLGEAEQSLLEKLRDVENLTVNCLGYFNPIPSKLFQKIDVMIAGAGCANIAYRQGLPVIIPDAHLFTGAGILGYTTHSTLYGEHEYSYVELLENVLITKEYLNHPFIKRNHLTVEEAYNKFWEFVSKSSTSSEYYNFHYEKQHLLKGPHTLQFFKTLLDDLSKDKDERGYLVGWIKKRYGEKIALFGYGRLGQRIKKSIPELSFELILDNKAENFSCDESVVSPTVEVLQHVDIIFISTFGMVDEMIQELKDKQFKGTCVSFIQVLTEYLEERILGVYSTESHNGL